MLVFSILLVVVLVLVPGRFCRAIDYEDERRPGGIHTPP
jgi:hypothetical protein